MSEALLRKPVVCLENVSKIFGSNERATAAVRGVNLQAYPGELILLLGPSGSGKTTLLTLMAGLSQPTAGRTRLFGKFIDDYSPRDLQTLRARRVGFVFQTFLLLDSLTAKENVAMVLRFNGHTEQEGRRRAMALLERFEVGHLADKFPRTMSQGEKQRVAIARALANDAELIIADEPTGSLETRQGLEIIRLLHGQAKDGKTCVIVASHDLRLAEFSDRIFRLEDGRLRVMESGEACAALKIGQGRDSLKGT
jgi:putative ABC transport system ATP-binding protein